MQKYRTYYSSNKSFILFFEASITGYFISYSMEGSLVIYNGELYYVENVQFKHPYIYSKKGGRSINTF